MMKNKKINFPLEFPVAVSLVVVLVVAIDLGLYLFKWGELQQNSWELHEYQAQARREREVLGASTSAVPIDDVEEMFVDPWKCVDSDYDLGEEDKFESGFAIKYGEEGNPDVVYDECSESGSSVYEAVCLFPDEENSEARANSVEKPCENGCQDGACSK